MYTVHKCKSEAYRKEKNIPYPSNIIFWICDSRDRKVDIGRFGYAIMEDDLLTGKERAVIHHRWKFGNTLAETSAAIGVTAERIRQIEHKALHKLLNASDNYFAVPYEDYKKALDTIDYLRAYIEEHNMQTRLERFEKAAEEHEKLKTKVDDMGLTVRSRNCLRRAGIDTIGDIVNTSKDDMMRIRCLGMHSLEEIINKVHEYGYKMKWEE